MHVVILETLHSTLKLLSEPTRLRLVALLSREELAVQELVAITGLAQSRVSNHLALLRRAGLVHDRREGTWSFHSLVPPNRDGALTPQLFAAAVLPYLESPDGQADLQALETVREQRRERSRRAHDRLADRWEEEQGFLTGTLRSEAFAALAPRKLVVADLGCGAGFLSEFFAERGARVLAVDHSEKMLDRARRRNGDRIEFREGDLESLPLQDGEVDAAFANLVWHHLADMDLVARETFRVVRPGGVAVVTDLEPHDADFMRDALGDLRLGLKADLVLAALARAGFTDLETWPIHDKHVVLGPRGTSIELPMFLVRGVKPRAEIVGVDATISST